MAAQPQPIRFGKYLLVDKLGRGGMAEVWKAKIIGPAGFQRTLVVKRILPHLAEDEHFVKMFVGEARLSARLSHANIVHVYELGDVDGEYFLAMEYVRGRDLVSVMRAHLMRAIPPPGLGAFVVREVCRALSYAHALTDDDGRPLRLIHRDVSPSNVMIAFDGSIKLLDFGIAKALSEVSENKTQTGTLKGKFGYMSPEQVEGKEIDHRTDLFAAGIILHEMLTGRRLFKGQTDIQTIAMVRDAKVDPPSKFNPEIPPELDKVVMRALARELGERYRGCDQMAFELDAVVHQLKWGAERVAGMLRELFPDEPSGTGQVVLPLEDRPPSSLTVGTPIKRRRKRRTWAAVVAFAVAAAAAGVAMVPRMRQSSTAAPAPPMESKPAPPVATNVSLRFNTTPPGAELFLDGETAPRGQTPMLLSLPRGNAVQKVLVRAPGYEPRTVEVTPDADSRLELTLTPLAKPVTAPHPARPKPKPVEKKASKPSRPDLRKGDVVDPFAN